MILKGFINCVYVALSDGPLLISVMSQQYNCLMELYTNFYNILLFMKMHLPSSVILRYYRADMNVHAFMNELDQKDYWYPRKKKKKMKIYVQSQWRVVLLWYHIFWQSSVQRGRYTQLCIITSLKWIIQICSNFYCWVCMIAFYSPNPHCCLRETSPLIFQSPQKMQCPSVYYLNFLFWCFTRFWTEISQTNFILIYCKFQVYFTSLTLNKVTNMHHIMHIKSIEL